MLDGLVRFTYEWFFQGNKRLTWNLDGIPFILFMESHKVVNVILAPWWHQEEKLFCVLLFQIILSVDFLFTIHAWHSIISSGLFVNEFTNSYFLIIFIFLQYDLYNLWLTTFFYFYWTRKELIEIKYLFPKSFLCPRQNVLQKHRPWQ